MTIWRHTCSLAWLQARQRFLTATDVKELLPFTKTGRKRVVDDATYMKVFSRKLCSLSSSDCKSSGAAARGHILEPFAIEMFNRLYEKEELAFHWDDVIITDPKRPAFGLAFSPDGLNVPMDYEIRRTGDPVYSFDQAFPPTRLYEVKSYGVDKHYLCGMADKMDLEEKWQIASAMVVCDTIEKAYLIFFNPSAEYQMFVHCYSREDLEDEIKTIEQIEKDWIEWVDSTFKNLSFTETFTDKNINEKLIINRIEKDEFGLPDNMKTVIDDD